MNEIKTILSLMIRIIFEPKKISTSPSLGKYDMKAMNRFIAFMSIVLWISNTNAEQTPNQYIVFKMLIIPMIPIMFKIFKKILVIFHMNLINTHVFYPIPYEVFDRILTPYIGTFILLEIVLNLVEFIFPWVTNVSFLILTLWYSLQINNIIISRIGINNIKDYKKLHSKLIAIVLIIIAVSFSHSAFRINSNIGFRERPKLNHEIVDIRSEVYQVCKEIFDEIEKLMEEGRGINKIEYERLSDERRNIVFIVHYFRKNEIKLVSAIDDMIEYSYKWNFENRMGNKIKAQDVMVQYKESVMEVELLIEEYYLQYKNK